MEETLEFLVNFGNIISTYVYAHKKFLYLWNFPGVTLKKKKSYKVLRIFRKNKIKILRKILRYITLFTCLFTFRVVTAANFQEPTQKYFDWVVDLVLVRTKGSNPLRFEVRFWGKILKVRTNQSKVQVQLKHWPKFSKHHPFISNKHYDSSSSSKSLKPTLSQVV